MHKGIGGSANYDRSPYDLYNRFPLNQENKSRSSRSNSSDDLRINTNPPDFSGGAAAFSRRNESMHQYSGGMGRGNLQSMQQPLLQSK